jgi:hypothetical protein
MVQEGIGHSQFINVIEHNVVRAYATNSVGTSLMVQYYL